MGKSQRLADAGSDLTNIGEVAEDPAHDLLGKGFQQVYVLAGAFVDDGIAQLAVIKHRVDVIVPHLLRDIDVELRVDVQWLGGPQFVFQDPNAGVQCELLKDDASGGHVQSSIMLKSRSMPTRCWPPSTGRSTPVMLGLCSRNRTVRAISLGLLAWPKGARRCVFSKASSVCRWLGRVSPGDTATTRICGANAFADRTGADWRDALVSV